MSFIKHRLDKFRDWDFDVPLNVLWTVEFENFENLFTSITNVLNDFYSAYNTPSLSTVLEKLHQSQTQDIGLFLAHKVALPSEQYIAEEGISQRGHGGYVPGYVGGTRIGFVSRPVTINFIENNKDFTDLVLRPWVVATSIAGLVKTNRYNLSCNIKCLQYTRHPDTYSSDFKYKPNDTEPFVRKKFTFFNCYPMSVDGPNLDYEHLDFNRASSFIYSDYFVTD